MANSSQEFIAHKKTLTAEFFVGIFFLVGLLCFGYLSINLAKIRLFKTGVYRVIAEFDNISGLNVGTPVEIAGVPIGEVVDISLDKASAKVTFEVRDNVQLHSDDVAAVRSRGIIGERYIKIVPGGSEEILKNGGQLSDTESVIELEDIIGKIIHKFEK